MDRSRATLAALAVTLALPLAGCAQISDQLHGTEVEPGPGTAGVVATSTTAPLLKTVEWSVTDGLLSVIVRNDMKQTLRSAQATVTAYDASGAELGTWGVDSMATGSSCCTVVELAPGEQYGLYFPIGLDAAAQVNHVRLSYRDVSWAPPGQQPARAISASGQSTQLDRTQTTVMATLRNGASPLPLVLVQATLRGQSGRLIAVVTGRWSCLQPHEVRPIVMQLFQPVPKGTDVADVTARPIVADHEPTCIS